MSVAALASGSPPRAWGQSVIERAQSGAWRFTPTGVGTIVPVILFTIALAVHPHGRGDNMNDILNAATSIGSPPRAWGQFRIDYLVATYDRFTPTGVGTMQCGLNQIHSLSVHPHGRGDNAGHHVFDVDAAGSPPRAWGQFHRLPLDRPALRFTPTGVGTMVGLAVAGASRAVHPHGRGDNNWSFIPPPRTGGSPPRAWGQCAGYPALN